MNDPKYRVQAVDIACQILTELHERDVAGVTDLAESLGYTKGTIHTQLATLRANEFVVKEGDSYRLSYQFLDIGEQMKDRIDRYDAITSEIDSLASKTNETAQFATEEHGQIVYLYKCLGDEGVATASSIGKRATMHSTALGKSILSQYSESRVEEILEERGMPRQTENTITTFEEFFDELEQVDERGYAIDDEEHILDLRCISVPVVIDNIVYALSISGPSKRMTDERIESELSEIIAQSSNVIQLNNKFL